MNTTDKAILVNWDPEWASPVIEADCPSCGVRRTRWASSWSRRTDGTLNARFGCEPIGGSDDRACWRVFDVTIDLNAALEDAVEEIIAETIALAWSPDLHDNTVDTAIVEAAADHLKEQLGG